MKKSIFLVLMSFLLFIVSCKKKDYEYKGFENVVVQTVTDDHEWYYFTDDGFEKVEKPEFSPEDTKIAWTEAVRISSANNVSANAGSVGYAILNRIGLLRFTEDKITLSKDISLFTERTCDNLIFLNDTPLFSVYKSSYFNDSITDESYKKNDKEHLFLLQYDEKAKVSFPLISCNSICDEKGAEFVDMDWNGVDWNVCAKYLDNGKILFRYFNFKPISSLLMITPETASTNLSIKEITSEDFRNSKAFKNFSNSPDRIKNLLNGLSDVDFIVEVKTAGGPSPRTYQNFTEGQNFNCFNAKAILNQDWCAALFEDGTFYFEGALERRHILRGGKPVALRLPKLPEGFKYDEFVICGKTLYASWEERMFYETTRSGFLAVDLNKTLYNHIN